MHRAQVQTGSPGFDTPGLGLSRVRLFPIPGRTEPEKLGTQEVRARYMPTGAMFPYNQLNPL
jgi:hypothetical protein